MLSLTPIPGYERYSITRSGEVYCGDRRLKAIAGSRGKSARIKLRVNGKVTAITVAKLVAMAHIPNPEQYKHIILIDRDKNNCHSDNIRWVSASDCTRYNQGSVTNEELIAASASIASDVDRKTAKPIPGYENYTITPNGKVYCGQRCLCILKSTGNRAPRVKLKDAKGEITRVIIARLLAITFIPNPHNHPQIIFKDRDKNNCTVNNIQWVSANDFIRFVKGCAEELLGPPRPKKQPDWIDPTRVPLKGYPSYYITPSGVLYKGNRIRKPSIRKGKAVRIRIWQNGGYKFLGLATVLAEHFIPNPRNYSKIIFKDRNRHNCCVENIAWVDGQTFIYYSGIYSKGIKKKVLLRDVAIKQCKNPYLLRYYQTLDEYWLHECWQELEKNITLYNWNDYRSECYLYFIDRAKRFSITGDPLGLMLLYMKGVRNKVREEISPYMPISAVKRSDESLRIIKARKDY